MDVTRAGFGQRGKYGAGGGTHTTQEGEELVLEVFLFV